MRNSEKKSKISFADGGYNVEIQKYQETGSKKAFSEVTEEDLAKERINIADAKKSFSNTIKQFVERVGKLFKAS
ncbi:MAG: hypothetical protein RCG15_03875 [Candidatus Rickettsia vulgarisii]